MDHFADKDAVAVIEDADTEEEEVRERGGLLRIGGLRR